ncbi:TIGR03756 family integrating conjugative element protein [Carnimonas bestiolae]|uniref:TIGR03756 family integrating conjugative element protein n=1 Tax=Carnimonas bestiolae TaxID=3402172 RepID=UPI003EDC0C1F
MNTVKRLVFLMLSTALLMTGLQTSPAFAINTASIVASTPSSDCLDYKIIGICEWLHCNHHGCHVRTSVRVKHFVPDLVVSSYETAGDNPWTEASLIQSVAAPVNNALGGGQTNEMQTNQHINTQFKNVDAIGHPGAKVFDGFASSFGMACHSGATAFEPYFVSTLDVAMWRSGIPEMGYPEALTPGKREMGEAGDLWGNIYPRSGFVSQTNDYKTAAVTAQRAADIITRGNQTHVYRALLPKTVKKKGWWATSSPVTEGDAKHHKWQRLSPHTSHSCSIFPDGGADQLDSGGDYVWALWRPYACCEKRGEKLLVYTGGNP